MNGYPARIQGRRLYLIDSPGFDDTERSEAEILHEVALSLSMMYESGTKILGILYLCRITDTRVHGAALKSINILQKMCGEEAFPNITVVTTMWNQQEQTAEGGDKGIERENQLMQTFFASMVQRGTQFRRHHGDRDNAEAIVSELVLRNQTVVLDLQKQMDRGLALSDTPVGQLVEQEQKEQQRRYEQEIRELEDQLRKAQEKKEDGEILALREELQQQRALQANLEKDRRSLGANLHQIAEKRNPQYAAYVQESKKIREEQRKITIQQNQLTKLEEASRKQELELRRLREEQYLLQMQAHADQQQQQRMIEYQRVQEAMEAAREEERRREHRRKQRELEDRERQQSMILASLWDGVRSAVKSILPFDSDCRREVVIVRTLKEDDRNRDTAPYYDNGMSSQSGRW